MLFLKAKIIGLFYRATNHHIVNVKEQGLCHIQSTDDTPFNITLIPQHYSLTLFISA